MFYKGIVVQYDAVDQSGCIELVKDQRIVYFHVSDFPNAEIQPQLNERIKCLVVESEDSLKANCIVRLDIKNSVQKVDPYTEL